MSVKVNPISLLRAVLKDIKPHLKYHDDIHIGRCKPLMEEDEYGNLYKLKYPYQCGVEVEETENVTYFIELNYTQFYLQNVYSIAHTRDYENPHLVCVFYHNKYVNNYCVVEANTYKVLKNFFNYEIENRRYDEKHGYKPKRGMTLPKKKKKK